MARWATWSVAAALAIAALGAKGSSREEEPPKAAEAPSAPISREEALEFGEGLAEAFEDLDAEAIEQGVDMNAVMEAAAEGVAAPAQFREGFLQGVKKAQARSGHPLFVELRPAIAAGAEPRATRGLEWQGRPAFLLRTIHAEGAASYIVFLLARRPDGRIRAVDYYSLASGELASEAIRRLYAAGVAQFKRGLLARLLERDQSLVKHMGDLQRMTTANREGRADEVLKIYDALPEEMKNEKIFQTLRYAASQKTGDEAKYLEAIQDFARRFPGDPACDFLLLDGYILMKEPEKTLPCFERLDKALGGDAYLKVLRGTVMTILERPDDAAADFRAAIAEEPDLRQAYDGLLNSALSRKRFGEVAEALDAVESEFEEDLGDLSDVAEFEEFLESPEGKAWSAKRDAPEPEPEPKPKPDGEEKPEGDEKTDPAAEDAPSPAEDDAQDADESAPPVR